MQYVEMRSAQRRSFPEDLFAVREGRVSNAPTAERFNLCSFLLFKENLCVFVFLLRLFQGLCFLC